MIARVIERARRFGDVAFLAFVSFVPTLVFSDGTYNADTKLYLTTNVGRLISQSRYAWDPSQFGGYVPHQAVGYLWPMGPFYWILNAVGLPGWFAQRAFVATLFFLGSVGVLRLLRHLGFSRSASLVAAIAYQFTPYVLAYQSRTSAMLLPWCGLPWIILAVDKGLRSNSWRYPALIALIVASIGGINATSLIMIAMAPALYVLESVIRRASSLAVAVKFVARTGFLCVITSLWWIAMVVIQGRYGADVLAYSETLQAVSSTSVSTEVFRGLGYWLNYVVTPTYASTSRALLYLDNAVAVAFSYVVPLAGLVGLAFVHSRVRRVATWWLLAGVVLAVGVYPLDNSSILTRLLARNPDSSLSLALRSSTRAIPVLNLALVFGLASLITVIQDRMSRGNSAWTRSSRRLVVPFSIACCMLVLPSRFVHGIGDQSLAHAALPTYWSDAGVRVNSQLGDSSRVAQLPGQEFGAYSWGYTVDPALAGATTSSIITRDLLPLGNPQAMDLVNAVDDAARNEQIDQSAWERLAWRLGAGALVIPHDLDFPRFGTYSSRSLEQELTGLSSEVYGTGDESVSIRYVPGASIARLEKRLTIVEGSGEGLVNIARSGIDTGVVRYASDMSDDEIEQAIHAGASLIITDTNRIQARHWRGSLDTLGLSEDSHQSELRISDSADRRLPLFVLDTDESHTVVRQIGRVKATASSYGYPLGYWPETRPALAIDGRADTAWTTGAFADPVGESISIIADSPIRSLRLIQPDRSRWISRASYRLNNETTWTPVELEVGERLMGQDLQLAHEARRIAIRIDEVRNAPGFTNGDFAGVRDAVDGVGFAEIVASDIPTSEETAAPTRLIRLASNSTRDRKAVESARATYVFSRQRAPQTSWWRSDPEATLSRIFTSLGGKYLLEVRGHLDINDEASAAKILGVSTHSDGARSADLSHAAWYATDGDSSTSWRVRYGQTLRPTIVFPTRASMSTITLDQCNNLECNAATRVSVTDERGTTLDREVRSGSVDVRGLVPGVWRMRVIETTGRSVTDVRFGSQVELPFELFELRGTGVVVKTPTLSDASARENAVVSLNVNGRDVSGQVTQINLLSNGRFKLALDVTLSNGVNQIKADGSALMIDDVVFSPVPDGTQMAPTHTQVDQATPPYEPLVISGTPTHRRVTVPAHESGAWFVFAEGFSPGWSASLDGKPLSGHQQVDGGFNAWLLPGSATPSTLVLAFEPQRLALTAQIISLVAALACLLSLLVTSRQKRELVVENSSFVANNTFSKRQRLAAALSIVVLPGILITPSAFTWAILAAVLVVIARRTRQRLAVSILFIAYSLGRVIFGVATTHPPARFDWPTAMSSFHGPMMVGLVTLTVLVTLTSHEAPAN